MEDRTLLLLTVMAQLLALGYAFVLPGVLIGLVAGRDWSWPMRLGTGFTLGVLVVPLACFAVAWLLGTNIQLPLVLAVATVINLLGLGGWRLRVRLAPPPTAG